MRTELTEVRVIGVVSSPTRNGRSKYTVQTSDGGHWVTLDPNLANRIAAFAGSAQTVMIRTSVTQDGRDTHYNLEDFLEPWESAAAARKSAATGPRPQGVELPELIEREDGTFVSLEHAGIEEVRADMDREIRRATEAMQRATLLSNGLFVKQALAADPD